VHGQPSETLFKPLSGFEQWTSEVPMSIVQPVLKHLTWYFFLALFALTALLLAFSSSAGIVFSLVLAGMITLMQLAWLALAELRLLRIYQVAQLEVAVQSLEAQLTGQETMASGAAPVQSTMPLETTPAAPQPGSLGIAND
jgi:hypothetical protein